MIPRRARHTVTFALLVVLIYLPGWFAGRLLGWW
jgi:hypothetical protein